MGSYPSLARARAIFYKSIRAIKERHKDLFNYMGEVTDDYREIYTSDTYALVEKFGECRTVVSCAVRELDPNPHMHPGVRFNSREVIL